MKRIRKQYLINTKVQLTMIAIPLIIYSLCLEISLIFLSTFYQESFAKFHAIGIEVGHPIYDYLRLQKSRIFNLIETSILVGFILNTLITIWITHKIVGPVYRLKKSMEGMLSSQDIPPIKLRKGDFFVEEADLLEQIRKRGLK